MSAHPEEQAPPLCKANVRIASNTGRPKLTKFNDRNGSLWRDLHSDPEVPDDVSVVNGGLSIRNLPAAGI